MDNKGLQIIEFDDDEIKLDVNIDPLDETIWLSQLDMSTLFETTPDNIGLHIKNIFLEQELIENSTTEEYSVVRKEGNRNVTRKIKHYNFDVIISVGYRVKSKRATNFRIWATKILKEYAIKGIVLNREKIGHDKYLEIFGIMNRTSTLIESNEILSILEMYTKGLQLLDDYDHQRIEKPMGEQSTYILSYDECISFINIMKAEHETDVFGVERRGSFKSSINAIYQTYDGNDLYQSVEEKAAHLLYFLVKNHGFIDGNKRIAAGLFVYFLDKNNSLVKNGKRTIDNNVLVALTIMLAESNPSEKELLINLIMKILVSSV